jgi:CRISPR/Cas system CSM-associated protein Csm3 (group 7 of RAMP superfamily)
VQRLFGTVGDDESVQSWVVINDALGNTPGIELRDGVSIDPITRTAEYSKKYDLELLRAGTTFPISLELLISEEGNGAQLMRSLALALRGLERGEIGIGMRKHQGLGRCRVTEWRLRRYRMTNPTELVAWLENDRVDEIRGESIADLLGVSLEGIDDARATFSMSATFNLASSLLLRSKSGSADAPDMVHLRSYRPDAGHEVPILSGTSLVGAIRARASRIANTLLPDKKAKELIRSMFGPRIESREDTSAGSRVIVQESVVRGGTDQLVQQRVKIDRFTGGAYPQALFSQQPLFAGENANLTIHLKLHDPQDAEIGLLLLVLKDLWTEDLPLGGESSVGRGRLKGQEAKLCLTKPGTNIVWELSRAEYGKLDFGGDGDPSTLEQYVARLNNGGEGG